MLPTVHFHDLKQPATAAAQTAPQQIATTTNKVAKTKAAGKKAAQA
jgi:hypothetical protein